CRRELPDLDALQASLAARGFTVLALSNEERPRLQRFASKYPYSVLTAYTSDLRWLDVPGRPMTALIDRNGIVRDVLIGARNRAEFEPTITRLLEERRRNG